MNLFYNRLYQGVTNGKKILVIEDDPATSRLVDYSLRHEGYQVFSASNGLEGIRKAKTEAPDLVILDVMLPGMDGFEICHRLQLAAGQSPTGDEGHLSIPEHQNETTGYGGKGPAPPGGRPTRGRHIGPGRFLSVPLRTVPDETFQVCSSGDPSGRRRIDLRGIHRHHGTEPHP